MGSFKMDGGDSWFHRHKALTVIGAILIVLFIGGSLNQSPPSSRSAADKTASGQQSSPSVAQKTDPNLHFGDGTFAVGKDVQAGTYRTRSGSSGCYYERMKDFNNGVESILANDNTDAPAVVTILPTDAGFKSKSCGSWTQNLSAITTSQTSFADGEYIVGTDMQPGTYKSSGGSGCYWARLADFVGGVHSLLANDNTDTPAIVAISATDKGFQSKGCGTWTKQ